MIEVNSLDINVVVTIKGEDITVVSYSDPAWYGGSTASAYATSVATQGTVNQEINTPFAEVNDRLPAYVTVNMSNGSASQVSVTWAVGTYDKTTVGNYTLTGTLSGVNNPNGVTASIIVAVFWSPNGDSRNILWGNIANRYSMFVESYASKPVTPVVTAGDKIGMIQDRAAGYVIMASSAGRAGTYSVDSDGLPMLTCDGVSTNLTVVNSTKYLAPFSAVTPSWHTCWKIKRGVNGVIHVLFSSNNAGSNPGIYLNINASNQMEFLIGKTGATMKFYTSTFTITAANNRVDVYLEVTGTTGRLLVYKGGILTTENITSIAVGAVADAFIDLSLFAKDTSAANPFNGQVGDFVFRTGALSAQDITNWQNYLPKDSYFRYTPIPDRSYDFNDSTKIWADAAGTTPITNNTVTRLVNNGVTSVFGSQGKDLTAGATTGALWKTSQQNGLAACVFDGVDDEFAMLTTEKGGRCTYFIVYKNQDNTTGSNIMTFVQANGEDNAATAQLHGAEFDVVNSSGTVYLGSWQTNTVNACNVHCIEQDGAALRLINGALDIATLASFTDAFQNINIGHGIGASTFMDGPIFKILKYVGIFATADRNAIITAINTAYNITPETPQTLAAGQVTLVEIEGQSNVGGQNNWGHVAYSSIPANLAAKNIYARTWHGSGFTPSFTVLPTKTWGWPAAVMYAMAQRMGKPFFVVKYGLPSAGLGPDGTLFPRATGLSEAQNAYNYLNGLYPGRVRVIKIWDDGQTDSAFVNNANLYPSTKPKWFADWRAVDQAYAPIINFRLPSWDPQTYKALIIATDNNLNSPNVDTVNNDLTRHEVDNQHFNDLGCSVDIPPLVEAFMIKYT